MTPGHCCTGVLGLTFQPVMTDDRLIDWYMIHANSINVNIQVTVHRWRHFKYVILLLENLIPFGQHKITLLSLVTLCISRMVKLASLVWFSWLTIKFLPSLHDFGEEILCKSITVASMTIWYPSRLTSWIICMYKNVHLSTSLLKIQKMTWPSFSLQQQFTFSATVNGSVS